MTTLTVANPIRSTRESYDYSIEELAKLMQVNSSLLYLVERGCYSKVPKRILEYFYSEFLNEDEESLNNLTKGYRHFQQHQRFGFGVDVRELVRVKAEKTWKADGWNEVTPCSFGGPARKRALEDETKRNWIALLDGALIPVANFYTQLGLTRTAFCKLICIQPSLLYSLETHKSTKIPESILLAFEEAYFPDFFVEEFQDRMESYFARV